MTWKHTLPLDTNGAHISFLIHTYMKLHISYIHTTYILVLHMYIHDVYVHIFLKNTKNIEKIIFFFSFSSTLETSTYTSLVFHSLYTFTSKLSMKLFFLFTTSGVHLCVSTIYPARP